MQSHQSCLSGTRRTFGLRTSPAAMLLSSATTRTNNATRGQSGVPCYGVMRHRPARKPATTTARAAAIGLDSSHAAPNVRWWDSLLSSPYDMEIIAVALPALCGMLLDPIMGVINSAFMGQLGTQQLGAVSVGSLAISFCTFLFSFLLFLTTPEIASAVAKSDKDRVSKVAAKGLWVAAIFGTLTTVAASLGAETIIAYLAPPEPAVAVFATQFIQVRCLGIVPALMGFVAIGVFRGHRDTLTPLYAAVGSAVASLTFNVLFLYGFGWGVFGSALASALAATVSCVVLLGLLMKQGMLRLPDLLTPPSWAAIAPVLRAGVPLAFRNIISFGMVLYASLLCVRAGSVYQASFEVVRQVWILTIQFFECLNVATQALCSGYLGSGDPARARDIMLRIATLGSITGALVGVVVFACQQPLVRFFTSDPAVMAQVLATLPMVACFLPLDAIASIMDGSLMAAKQTDYLSIIQIGGAGFQYFALIYLAQNGLVSALSIWACLKLLTVFRLAGGYVRNFVSDKSAYKDTRPAVPAAAAAAPIGMPLLPAAAAAAAAAVQPSSPGAGRQQQQQWEILDDSMDADCGAEPCFVVSDEDGMLGAYQRLHHAGDTCSNVTSVAAAACLLQQGSGSREEAATKLLHQDFETREAAAEHAVRPKSHAVQVVVQRGTSETDCLLWALGACDGSSSDGEAEDCLRI